MGLKMNTGVVKSQLSDMNRNLDTMVSRANLLQSRVSELIWKVGLWEVTIYLAYFQKTYRMQFELVRCHKSRLQMI